MLFWADGGTSGRRREIFAMSRFVAGAVALAAPVVVAPTDSAADAISWDSVVSPLPEPTLCAIVPFDEPDHDAGQLRWSTIAVSHRNHRGTNVAAAVSLAIKEAPKKVTEQFAYRHS